MRCEIPVYMHVIPPIGKKCKKISRRIEGEDMRRLCLDFSLLSFLFYLYLEVGFSIFCEMVLCPGRWDELLERINSNNAYLVHTIMCENATMRSTDFLLLQKKCCHNLTKILHVSRI
jgi:hypothetical protein